MSRRTKPMNRSNFLPRAAALLLTLVLMVCTALPGFAVYQMPIQTVSDTESVYLFNLDTGKPILQPELRPAAVHRQPDQDDDGPARPRERQGYERRDHHSCFPDAGVQGHPECQRLHHEPPHRRDGAPHRPAVRPAGGQRQRRGQRHRQRCLGRRPDGLCGPDECPRQGAGL